MRQPVYLPSQQEIFIFVAALRDNDWSLRPALAVYRDRFRDQPEDAVIALLGAFALLTGQEEAFDVYGDEGGRGGALYHRRYTFDKVTNPSSAWGLLPRDRQQVLSDMASKLPDDIKGFSVADVFRQLLRDGRSDDAATLAHVVFFNDTDDK